MGSKYTPLVAAPELWDARLVASYTVNQLAEQQYRLDQLVHCPSAIPSLGAWAHVTDLSGTEDMEVDPMHMDPLQAAAPSHPLPTPCVLPHSSSRPYAAGNDSMSLHCSNGGDLASCLGTGHRLHQQQQQGCFQLRSGRYGRRGGPVGSSTAGHDQQQRQQKTGEENAALNLDIPSEHVPGWMRMHLEKSANASSEGRWHATTQRRFAQLGHKWRVVNTWRGVKFKGTDILRQKLACAEAMKHGCQAMAMVYRQEYRPNAATDDSEDSEESADKGLGEDEPMLVRFAGTHNHLQQQSKIHGTQHQIANDLMEDHLPLALLDQLRGAAPSCALYPRQHPTVPPSFHQLPFLEQQQQPLFPIAPPPGKIPHSSTAVNCALAGATAIHSAAATGAAVGSTAVHSNEAECRMAVSSAAVSRYSLRGMDKHRRQQLDLAACPGALLGKTPSVHPIAAFACSEVTASLIAHVEAALKRCDPCTTTVFQLWQLLLQPVARPSLPRPPTIERVREVLLCLAHRQEALSLAVQHTQLQHGGCAGAASIAQQQLTDQGSWPLPHRQTCQQVHPDRQAPDTHIGVQPQDLTQVHLQPEQQLGSQAQAHAATHYQRQPGSQAQAHASTWEQGQGHDRQRGPKEQQYTPTQQQQQQQQCVALPAARLEGALRRWLEQQSVPAASAPASSAGTEGVLGTSAARAATHALELLRSVLSSRSALHVSSMQPQLHGTSSRQATQVLPEWSRLPALLRSFAQGRQQQRQQQRQRLQDREEDRQEAAYLESLQQAESFISSLVRAEGDPDSASRRAYWMPPPPTPGSNTHPWSMARLLPVVGLTASDPLATWGADAHTHAPPLLPHDPHELQQQQQQQDQALQQKLGKGAKKLQRSKGHTVLEDGQQEQQGEQQQEGQQGEEEQGDGEPEAEHQRGTDSVQSEATQQREQQLEEQLHRHHGTKRKQQEYAGKLRLELSQAGFSPSVIAEWTAVALCWSSGKQGGRTVYKWPERYVHPQYGTYQSIDEVLKLLRRTQQQQQEGQGEGDPGADAAQEGPDGAHGEQSSEPRQRGQPKRNPLQKRTYKKVQEALQWEKEVEEEEVRRWQRAQAQRLAREPSARKHVGVLRPQALRGNMHVAPPIVLLPPTFGHPGGSNTAAAAAAAAAAAGVVYPQLCGAIGRSATLDRAAAGAGTTAGSPAHAPLGEEPEGVQGPGSRPFFHEGEARNGGQGTTTFQPNSIWKRPPPTADTRGSQAAPPACTVALNPHARPPLHQSIGPPRTQPLHLQPHAPPSSSLYPPAPPACAHPYAAPSAASRPQPLLHQSHVSSAAAPSAAAGASQPLPAAAQLQSAGWGAKVAALGRRARAEVRPNVLQAASARLAAILGRSGNLAGSAGAGECGGFGAGDGAGDGAGGGGNDGDDGDAGTGRDGRGTGEGGAGDGTAYSEQGGDDEGDAFAGGDGCGTSADGDRDAAGGVAAYIERGGNDDDVGVGNYDVAVRAGDYVETCQGAGSKEHHQSSGPKRKKRKANDVQ